MSSSRRVVDLRPGRAGKDNSNRKPTPSRVAREPESPRRAVPLRIRRRRRRIIISGSIALFIVILVGAVSWLSYFPEFAIKTIEVDGAKMIPEKTIVEHINAILDTNSRHLLSQRNIYVYPRRLIETTLLADFPRIKSVKILPSKLFANAIVVQIEERETYAQWCVVGVDCYALDENGYVFATYAPFVDALPKTMYVFYDKGSGGTSPVGKQVIPEHFTSLIALMELIEKNGYVVHTTRIDGNDVYLALDEFEVKVSFGQDPDQLMKNLQLIVSTEPLKSQKGNIEYIDLRFDNRVYYKLKGQVEAPSKS